MSTDRPPRRRPVKPRVTRSLAILIAVAALVTGILIGYAARGGPGKPVLVTTNQEIEVLTVTQQAAP